MTARQQAWFICVLIQEILFSKNSYRFLGGFAKQGFKTVWGSSPGTGLSRLHRVSGGHQHIWLRISSLRGNSSEAACFKKKGSSKVTFMIRKERTNHLDQGNKPAPGSLNFSAGHHRFLLPFRHRRGFDVTSHILCKPKILALDEFGLLTNYQDFFHPIVGRAYSVAVP